MDILYSVRLSLSDKNAFERFRCSLASLREQNNHNFNICVSDSSDTSLRHILDEIIGDVEYKYVHSPKPSPLTGQYWQAYTINIGIKHLTETDYVFINDIDFVLPPDFLDKVFKKIDLGFEFILFRGFRMQEEIYDWGIKKLDSFKKKDMTCDGTPVVKRSLLFKLNGYDEEYKDSGKEDSDLILRAKALKAKFVIMDDNLRLYHLWHPQWCTAPFDPKNRNRVRYRRRVKEISKGANPVAVNPNGWGEVV